MCSPVVLYSPTCSRQHPSVVCNENSLVCSNSPASRNTRPTADGNRCNTILSNSPAYQNNRFLAPHNQSNSVVSNSPAYQNNQWCYIHQGIETTIGQLFTKRTIQAGHIYGESAKHTHLLKSWNEVDTKKAFLPHGW